MTELEPDEPGSEAPVDRELAEVNTCLKQYRVEMFRGDDGKYRIWGDINRIQDIVDGPCLDVFPATARGDLDDFFASEVDVRIASCLRAAGVDATVDLESGPGIQFGGELPPDEVVERCFRRTYRYFSVPP